MRTLGDRKFVDLLFRQLQRGGYVKAPRLQAAGHLLQSSLVNVSVTETTADDINSLRRYIRETARAGADWIKFYATPNSSAPDPTLATYSKPEVDAIFFEARRINKPVSVHCHGGEAADWALAIASIPLSTVFTWRKRNSRRWRRTTRWCRRPASFSSGQLESTALSRAR